MKARVKNTITSLAKEGAKRPLSSPSTTILRWALLIVTYSFIVIYLDGLREDFSIKISEGLFLIELSLLIVLTISSGVAASILALPDVIQKAWIRFLPLIPLVIFTALLAYSTFASSALTISECMMLYRFDCIFHLIFLSLLPACIMFYSILKAAPIYCCWAGSMAGLSAASLGYVLLRIVEKSDDPFKLIIWHFLPVILIMMIGMFLGKFIFSKALKSHASPFKI